MANSFRFWTPAHILDFGAGTPLQDRLDALWNDNLNAFTKQGVAGNLWNMPNAGNITNYFNPLDSTEAVNVVPIEWPPFPGRILAYNPTMPMSQQLELADTGYMTVGGQEETFPNITVNGCTQEKTNEPYGPYGPRGWQDEYCEWSVERDPATNKILRVDMSCENPEYWNSLWIVSPEKVLTLYRETLGKHQIQLTDLELKDGQGNVVTDPSTGRPGYNPLNIWNSGPVSTSTGGGAMHLTSTPNTLQTEIGLASAATIQRSAYNYSDPDGLICCAQYGQIFRNSDPNIGATVNYYVGQGLSVTLANPPGLYIQQPSDWSPYTFPGDTTFSDWWTIARGTAKLSGDDGAPLPNNFILHAVFAPPAGSPYTVSDVLINSEPILWAGQIIQTLKMQIVAAAYTAPVPAKVGCTTDAGGPNLSQPLQLFHAAIFGAMLPNMIQNPVLPGGLSLLSNSTLIPPSVEPGATVPMVLTAITVGPGTPAVTFNDSGITASVTGSGPINYAVPGNTYPGLCTALALNVTVSESVAAGQYSISLDGGPPMPAMLTVCSHPDTAQ